jgi:hypothetical protein
MTSLGIDLVVYKILSLKIHSTYVVGPTFIFIIKIN